MENPEFKHMQTEVTEDDKLWGMLSWLFTPIVPIIVLLAEDKKDRPFIRFHAVNSLAVVAIDIVLSSVLSLVIIGCVIPFIFLAYQIYMAFQAYQGQWTEVPGLTGFLKGQGWI